MNDDFLPPVSDGFIKKTASPKMFHHGRHADVLKAREDNQAPVKVFTVGSNQFGQCGVLNQVRKIPIDNLHGPNFVENQKKMMETDHKWNIQYKLVAADDIPPHIESFQDAFGASSRREKPFQFTNIAAGRQTSLAIGWRRSVQADRRDWKVFAAGVNHHRQLGSHVTPTSARDLDGKKIKSQFDSRGFRQSVEEDDDYIEEDVIAAFREIHFENLNLPLVYRPIHISAGGGHTAVIFCHEDYDPFGDPQENVRRITQYPNLLVTMGDNHFGQCGDSSTLSQRVVETQTFHNGKFRTQWNPVKAFCGDSHTLIFSKNVATKPGLGWRLFGFGMNYDGQLGLGHLEPVLTPTMLDLPPLVQVSTNSNFSLSLDLHGNIWGWGDNQSAVFGSFTNDLLVSKPVSLSRLTKSLDSTPTMIAAGSQAAIILTRFGTVYTFGTGLLGHSGELTSQVSPLPVKIPNDFFGRAQPIAVFAGSDTFGVLTGNGELFNWGVGKRNSIGIYEERSAKQTQSFPWKVSTGIGSNTVLDFAFGDDHSILLAVP